jgi:hypothetical protein
MSRARNAKAARVAPAAFANYYHCNGPTHPRLVDGRAQVPRSAVNWLLDAAVYLRDGDRARARLAALRGLRAMRRA